MTSIGGTARPPSMHGAPRRCLPGGRSAWLGAHRGAAALPVSGALRLLRKEPRQPPALRPSLPAPPAAGAAAALAPGPERRSLVPAEGAAGRAGALSGGGGGQCGAAGAVSDSGGGQWGGAGGGRARPRDRRMQG